MSDVFVTRPAHQAAGLAAAVAVRGHRPILAPALRLSFIDGPALEEGDAIAVTSANGVAGLARRMTARGAQVFAVGAATEAAARAAGFDKVESAAGDGASLARLIAARLPPGSRVTYAAGAETAFDLGGVLRAQGFDVRQASVYAMVPETRLPGEALAALDDGAAKAALLLSARSAASFGALAQAAGRGGALGRVTALCLSEAVAAAATGAGFTRTRAADNPSQDALLDLLDAWRG